MKVRVKRFVPRFDEAPAGAEGAPAGGEGAPADGKSFTQDDVNRILAKETAKFKQSLESVKNSKNLSDEEKTELQKQIDNISNEKETLKDRYEREMSTTRKQHETALKKATTEAEAWKTLYTSSKIENDLKSQAEKAGAFKPKQIFELLKSDAVVEPVLDKDGKETKAMVTLIKVVDADGKTLKLPVDQAITRLSESEENANLFTANLKGGLGGQNVNNQQIVAPSNLGEYKKNREAILSRDKK